MAKWRVAEGDERVEWAAPRLGSQGTPKDVRAVERKLSRAASAASSERKRNETFRKEAFVNRQGNIGRGIENARVIQVEESVRVASPWRS